jgi:type IV secretory pathway VirB4 component
MKKLQRFENFNMGFPWNKEEKINPKTRIEDFKREFKKIVDNTEEYEEGDEPTMNDILSEVGDLCNKYEMSKSDLKNLIDNNEDINGILQIMYEDTEEGNNNSTLVNLENMIRDIIQGELYLRDVPYSMEEGAQEVDPDSLDDAAKAVINLLKKEGYIK